MFPLNELLVDVYMRWKVMFLWALARLVGGFPQSIAFVIIDCCNVETSERVSLHTQSEKLSSQVVDFYKEKAYLTIALVTLLHSRGAKVNETAFKEGKC